MKQDLDTIRKLLQTRKLLIEFLDEQEKKDISDLSDYLRKFFEEELEDIDHFIAIIGEKIKEMVCAHIKETEY